jgi:hypothetical protein
VSAVRPEEWRSVFQTVDHADVAADLLEYTDIWRTPDGVEKLPPLTMQQAQLAVDNVMAFLNDRINKGEPA